MDSLTVKVEQMIARELRVARGWLITVTVLTFAYQMLYAFNLPPKLQGKQQLYVIVAFVQFAVFLGLWLLAREKPKHSLILALIVFWVLQLGVIVMSPLEVSLGVFPIILRLAFTLALIGGISAANRAEEMARTGRRRRRRKPPTGSDGSSSPDPFGAGFAATVAAFKQRALAVSLGWVRGDDPREFVILLRRPV